MNLEHAQRFQPRDTPPWVFVAEIEVDAKSTSDKNILNCLVYKNVSRGLAKQLFETQKPLCDSLQGGLSVQFYESTLEHFNLEGRFDRAICKITLPNRGPARFLLETHFFLGDALVTLAKQEGMLYFEELN
jgi:hypothetical protein